jgi:hypothetical protein
MPTIESAMADDIDDVDAMLEDVFNKKVFARSLWRRVSQLPFR